MVVPGANDESIVSRALFNALDSSKYIVLNNLTLPNYRRTAAYQIDHIVVSAYGIFCIETQSRQGWVFGEKKSDMWKQVLDEKKFTFPNPLTMNDLRVKAIEQAIGRKRVKAPSISLVVFPSVAKLFSNEANVFSDTMALVSEIEEHKDKLYSEHEITEIVHKLKKADITDREIIDKRKKEVTALIASSAERMVTKFIKKR